MEVEPELDFPGANAGTLRNPCTTSPTPTVGAVESEKRVTVGAAGPVPP